MNTLSNRSVQTDTSPGGESTRSDAQLRRDRLVAIAVLAVAIAAMAFMAWLASLGGPVGPHDYWPMMP